MTDTDTDFAREVLTPILDSPFIARYIDDTGIHWLGIFQPDNFGALSSGEQALVRIAHALWRWMPIAITDLQALDTTLRGRTLAVIVRSLRVTEVVVHELAVDLYGI